MNKIASFISLLFLLFSISGLAMEQKEASWTVLKDLDDAGRVEFLYKRAQDAILRNVRGQDAVFEDYFFTTQEMRVPQDGQEIFFGRSQTYLGDIEKEWLDFLQNIDEKGQEKTVLVAACGFGRAAIDSLKKSKFLQVIANDISEDAMDVLEQAKDYYLSGEEQRRLDIRAGDIFAVLRNLPSNSVDGILSTLLIHFFDPRQLDEFFFELGRVLKPGGQAFLKWEGHSLAYQYAINPSVSEGVLFPIIKDLSAVGAKYPTFFSKRYHPEHLSKPLIAGQFNYFPMKDACGLAHTNGLKPVSQREVIPMSKNGIMRFSTSVGILAKGVFFAYSEQAAKPELPLACPQSNVLTLVKIADAEENLKADYSYSADFVNGTWEANLAKALQPRTVRTDEVLEASDCIIQ